MNRVSHLTRDAYRRDKDRNLVFHSQRDVLGQPRVRFVDGKLRRPRRVSGRQPVPYVFQPILIASGGSLIESRKRSEEHTSELQSLMRISYAVFCLKKKKI